MGIIRGVAKGIEEDFYPLFLIIIEPFALREISTQVMPANSILILMKQGILINFDETTPCKKSLRKMHTCVFMWRRVLE